MDSRELMIGNWVNRFGNPLRITGAIDFTFVKDFEPIPLTTEILEKNGFVKVNSQRYDYGCPDTDCYVKVNPKKNMIHVNGRNANCNLYSHSFVHELQRALRVCGLNELADNFKV